LESVKPERAIKPRNHLWVWTDRVATFSSAMDVLPEFDFLTQLYRLFRSESSLVGGEYSVE